MDVYIYTPFIVHCADGAGAYTYGEQLAKPLVNGDWAVLLLNRRNVTTQITLIFLTVGDTK